MDLLIAATAKANNLILATLNTKDFDVIQGLTVEDWSKP
jgi:predicted nucleic acid-binding protein